MRKISAFALILAMCITMLSSTAFVSAAARTTYLEEELALSLKSLGIFKGNEENDFELNRAPTRFEAATMLVRLLGKENEALEGNWEHNFADVPAWADKYVGYAYKNGLVNGVSDTQFGSGKASACMYLTFVLRALGYSDGTEGDFSWDDPFALAKNVGLLPDRTDIVNFERADVVLISYSALAALISGQQNTLAEKLIENGAFSQESFETYYDADLIYSYESKKEYSAAEIYEKYSSAVFYFESLDATGMPIGNGSGFFIDSDGTAVVNYHEIDGAYSAKITIADTESVYDVLGVYDYSEEQDWAIIKVDGTGFSYLQLGNSFEVVGGEVVYAIGSPLGLQNTISQGIISNPKRVVDGLDLIQNTASINRGSSGGALLNVYGEVIGITTGSFDMVSLNVAVPVNYFKYYMDADLNTFLELMTGKGASIVAYSKYKGIPDCGAFYGVPLLSENSSSTGDTYYYSIDALNEHCDWVSSDGTYPKYLDLLSQWGLEYITMYSTIEADFYQFLYEDYENSENTFIVIVGTQSYNGTDCLSVKIIKS